MTPIARSITRRGRRTLLAASLVLASVWAAPAPAQQGRYKGCELPFSGGIPPELSAFVQPGTRPLCAVGGDLNGDGLGDFVLVLEQANVPDSIARITETPRPLLVVVREPGGALRVAARNDHVVYCSACGGVFGDPFGGVGVEAGSFTVFHYGGSAWRWRADYTFRYAPSAGTWRLARVVEVSYHTSKPDAVEQTTFVAPDHFGEIDLARFHPERWRRQPAR